jgi:hypothetical protein
MGIEAGDCALSERRHRHDVDVAGRNYSDYPKLGHYDTWDVDLLQELVERNTGELFPGWCNVNDYEDTDESFVTAPIHDQELQTCLEGRVEELRSRRSGFEPIYSRDISFLCNAWGVTIPFLPLMNKKEFKWFSELMLQQPNWTVNKWLYKGPSSTKRIFCKVGTQPTYSRCHERYQNYYRKIG